MTFCFYLQPQDIDNSGEETISDTYIPFVDDSPTDDIESPEFDKFLGVYVTLPGDDRESMVLARIKNRKRNHECELVETSNPTLF